uniref:Uncharacterized protein n=1 Tax=Setaria italica TaxID=4555 RepID=K3Y3D4_SETIT
MPSVSGNCRTNRSASAPLRHDAGANDGFRQGEKHLLGAISSAPTSSGGEPASSSPPHGSASAGVSGSVAKLEEEDERLRRENTRPARGNLVPFFIHIKRPQALEFMMHRSYHASNANRSSAQARTPLLIHPWRSRSCCSCWRGARRWMRSRTR